MNTVLLGSKSTCPPLSALAFKTTAKEDPFIVDSEDESDGSGSEAEDKPLYFRQHEALTLFMKAWIKKDLQFTDETMAVRGYPDRAIGNSNISRKLLRLDHGDILKNMLMATGVRWVSATKSQIATQVRTYANHSVTALWTHLHHGVQFLQESEVWTLRDQLHAYLTKALVNWPGFWDGVDEKPEDVSPELSQTLLSRPRKLELEAIAKEMEKRTEDSFLKIVQILLIPEMGSIPARPGIKADYLLTSRVCDAAHNLMKVPLTFLSPFECAHPPTGNICRLYDHPDHVHSTRQRNLLWT